MENTEPRLAGFGATGQMLGVSESTVRRLVRAGELRAIRLFTDQRIPVSEIDRLIERKLAEGSAGKPDTSQPAVTA